MMNRVDRGMGVSDEGGDRRRGRNMFWGYMGHPIATNGDFVA